MATLSVWQWISLTLNGLVPFSLSCKFCMVYRKRPSKFHFQLFYFQRKIVSIGHAKAKSWLQQSILKCHGFGKHCKHGVFLLSAHMGLQENQTHMLSAVSETQGKHEIIQCKHINKTLFIVNYSQLPFCTYDVCDATWNVKQSVGDQTLGSVLLEPRSELRPTMLFFTRSSWTSVLIL